MSRPSEPAGGRTRFFLRLLRRDEAIAVDNPEIYVFRIAANLLRDRARRAASHRVGKHKSLEDLVVNATRICAAAESDTLKSRRCEAIAREWGAARRQVTHPRRLDTAVERPSLIRALVREAGRDVPKTGSVKVEESAAVRLAARFRGPLMSFFLRRARSREDAEDLTQEVFLRLVRRDDAMRNPEIYVFRIAANLLRDRARKATTHRAADHASLQDVEARAADSGVWDEGLLEDRGPERVLLSQESLIEVVSVLGELGDRTRDIFLLFRLEGMPHRDIAALYGITVSAVEKHIAKASVYLVRRYGPI